MKESNSNNKTPQLVIENTPTTHQPIENDEGVIYDVELEITLSNIKKILDFSIWKKEIKIIYFGMDFQLKKWAVINLKLLRRFMI